jgi:sterol desaturase/sphingolipid hydroxylase (fatty acid hydroxylase superfamily)
MITLSEALKQLRSDNLLLLSLPLFLFSMFVENWFAKKASNQRYRIKDFYVSIALAIVASSVELIPDALAFMGFWYGHNISPLKDIVGRQWWAWLLLFFMDDFSYYWFHRMSHKVHFFWASHVVHHSSEQLNFSTSVRQGIGIHKFFFWMWLSLLGFDPLMIFTMMSISLFFQFWVHTESIGRLPNWVEAIFNTPSNHRVHHASNIDYLDCNYAGVLIIWDKLFGTFVQEKAEQQTIYGLTTNIHTFNIAKVATHGYLSLWHDVKRAKNWRDKWKYIFFAPGWSHNGEDKRVKTFREKKL